MVKIVTEVSIRKILTSFIINIFIFKELRCNSKIYKAFKRIITLSVIKSETELIHISLHIIYRNVMIDSIYTSLDNCPKTLNAVGMLSITQRIGN